MSAGRSIDPRQMLDTFRSVVRFAPVETDPIARRLRRCATVDDLRRVARRRLPRGVFDYIDGGAEDAEADFGREGSAASGAGAEIFKGEGGLLEFGHGRENLGHGSGGWEGEFCHPRGRG